jgi:hypothetical protein
MKSCEAYWNDYAAHEDWQEGCSGLDKPIRWIDKPICENYEEAEMYISEHDKGWYDQLAVRFYDYGKVEPTKTYNTLKERSERLERRYVELRDNIHYKGVKSAYVSCRGCGSKLASVYFGDRIKNKCPVCMADLRPESTLQLIENAKENAEKARKDFKAEEKKLQQKTKSKAKLKWLVKIEYHT